MLPHTTTPERHTHPHTLLAALILCALVALVASPTANAQTYTPDPIPKPQPALPSEVEKIPKEKRIEAYKKASKRSTSPDTQFIFGSYGRANVGSNLRGGTGEQTRLIAHPPRLLERDYLELDFAYIHKDPETGARFRTQTTLALVNGLFHYSGSFDSNIALRNLYVEALDFAFDNFSVWVGSRMLRGDDVYLLDFWPLDEQNTVGGGALYRYGYKNRSTVGLHVGLNRLDNDFQRQFISVPNDDFGTREVLFLDRQRLVTTLRSENHFPLGNGAGLKVIAYGEGHTIAEGTLRQDDLDEETLPADSGWLLGAQVGLYSFLPRSFVNVFARYGSGLGAYDELAIPLDLDSEKTTNGASEFKLGLSSNIEFNDIGIMTGAYTRYFVDADPLVFDRDDAWEVGASVRPAYFLTKHIHLIGEANVQTLRPNGISPETSRLETPTAFELALLPSITLGKGSYSRPQLRLIYAATFLNDSALLTYAPDDPRRNHSIRHFLGLGVEWWFQNTRG